MLTLLLRNRRDIYYRLARTSVYVLSIGGAAMLAGCGGPQPPIGAAGAMAQSQAIANHAERGGSWMKSGSPGSDLLYVSGKNEVFVNSFPSGQKVGLLTGMVRPGGLCSDSSGDVFVLEQTAIQEFAHGGTSPIATLSYSGNGAGAACSWDPTTENLAVVYGVTLWLYVDAQGQPQTYTDSTFSRISGCAYDSSAHLFVAGEPKGGGSLALAEFDTQKGTFMQITLDRNLLFPVAGLGWDGTYLAIDQFFGGRSEKIERIQVSGSSGKVVGTVRLRGARMYSSTGSWIEGSSFVAPITFDGRAKAVDVWSYPKGGEPTRKLPRSDFPASNGLFGATVSVAPK
ncbi:MAG: hypothetical protein WB609_08570 [Candidatus Cybelea sp.]